MTEEEAPSRDTETTLDEVRKALASAWLDPAAKPLRPDQVFWHITYGDTMFDPNAPYVQRTRRERLADWWEWRVKERWYDFRWSVAGALERIAGRIKPL